ncbi:MAG: zinc metalloprotease HtpX [Candidatus Aenigmatarchaeota archaeon]
MRLLNQTKTLFLFALLTGIFLSVGFFLGGYGGAIIALVFAGFMNFISYWYSDSIVLKMYNAREIDEENMPELHRTVVKLSDKAEIPKPDLYEIDEDTPNAFATGRNPENSAVAVTSGLLEKLDTDEVEGVISHEITHIKNRDTLIQSITATVAGAITWIAHMLSFALIFGGRDNREAGSFLFVVFAPIAALLIRTAISRSREYSADRGGGKLTGKPGELASALRKISSYNERGGFNASSTTSHLFIYNPLKGESVWRLFSTHPPLSERVKRLENLDVS